MSRFVTVEIVAYVEVPDDTPLNLLMVDKNTPIEMVIVSTSPAQRAVRFQAKALTIQHRVTEGRFWLHDKPRVR